MSRRSGEDGSGMDGEGSRLGRRIGLVETTAVALGAMIGAGVYVSIGEAASTTGGSLVLAVLFGGGVATLNGLSSAELGADDPRAGGAYRFGQRLVAPSVGFLAGWLFLLAGLTAGATFALAFAAYFASLVPGLPARAVGVALALAAVALNVLGVRLSARAAVVLVAVNLAVLVAFVVLALPAARLDRFEPFFSGGVGGLLQASALLFFAFTGYARPVTIAEEVEEPARTLPRAVPAALGVAALLYLAVAAAAVGAVGPERLGADDAPLRAALVAGGGLGPTLVSVGALLASTGVLLTEVWGLSRLLFAMAQAGDLPGWLGELAEPRRVPRNAVLASGALLLALATLVDLRPALEASSLALLAYYAIMNLCALRLDRERRLYAPVVQAAGLAACALVALSLPGWTLLTVLCVAAVGLAYHALRRPSRR